MKKRLNRLSFVKESRSKERLTTCFDLVELSLTLIAFLSGVVSSITNFFSGTPQWVYWLMIVFAVIMLIASIIKTIIIFRKLHATNYYRAEFVEKLSKNVTASLNDANAAKVRSTLRYTYGNVHNWNPINYYKNVLVYDVHEQLRTILLSLKNVIIQTSPERFHDDNVTVDLIYCFPKEKEYDGSLPYNSSYNHILKKFPWKLISSGDRSVSAHSVKEWIESKDSFYAILMQKGYYFGDKKDLLGRYHVDTKDKEYNNDLHNIVGSIAGVVIDIKNDEPSRVLLRAILTINTYGDNLFDPNDLKRITKEEYENILKKNVIASYKSLLASELVQMYIRHSLIEDGRCPVTGALPEDHSNINESVHPRKCNSVRCNPRHCRVLKNDIKSFVGK